MKRATPFVLLLFTLSGTSGLIYEIVWIRQLSHLLGGTSYAISIVLAAFMGGLALGSRYFGRIADRTERPLRLYAQLELGIAALCLIVYAIIALAPPAYVALARALPAPALAAMRVLIAMLLLLPPTFLMGGTLPVLSRFVVHSRERLGRGLGLLYAVNTFGAVLGSFLAGFTLIASVGLAVSTAVAILLNLLIAAAVWLIDRGLSPAELPATYAEALVSGEASGADEAKGGEAGVVDSAHLAEPEEMNGRLLVLIFALSGFASLGYELYWSRALQPFLGNSTYAFSAMLTTFLLGLAAGGWLGGRLVDRVAAPSRLLGWIQIAVGATALSTVLLIWGWLPRLEESKFLTGFTLDWNQYLLRRFLVAGAVMVLPTFLTGMTFPVVNRIGIRRLSQLGRGVGGLYFSNTVGAILGSLAAGFVLLPLLGAKTALIATAGLSALLGLVAHLGSRQRRTAEPWLAALAFLLLLGLSPKLQGSGHEVLSDTQEAGDIVVFRQEDHAAETRVYRKPASGDLHMSVDGHHIGGSDPTILRKERILAHLPMLLKPDARRTLSIGLGSGITLGSLALYEELSELSCVEIVPGVVEGAKFFRSENGNVLADPRVQIHLGDGVQFLLTARSGYDIISSDSKLNPEYSGNAPLLSKDYYELCRDRLSESGVLVQWLALHLPNSELRVIARSFVEAFPQVALFWYDPANIILAGSRSPIALDMDAARSFAGREVLRGELQALQLEEPCVPPSLFIAGRERIAEDLGDGPVNTWQKPRIEFSMARAYRVKSQGYHEEDNLRWLRRMREPATLALKGEHDPERLDSFRRSAGKLLAAFGSGGGVNRLQTGVEHLHEGLAINPEDPRVRAYLASIERVGSELEAAMAEGRLETPEDFVRGGLAHLDAGEREEALELFERALELKPDDPNIQYNRLRTLRELGRTDDLRAGLESFQSEFPRDARGFSLKGRLLAAEGTELLAQAQSRSGVDSLRVATSARALIEQAVGEFERAVEIDAESPVHRNNLATALARLERYGEAAEHFARVCELDPDYVGRAGFFAAASYSMAGETEAAARWQRYCLERGHARPEEFRTNPFFENLRRSDHWDPALLTP